MNFFHSNGFANLCLAVAFLCMDNSWSPTRIKKEGCLTESLFLFCQIIIDNQFTQTLIHAVQNQLLSRCVVTRTSPVVVTSSVVVSSRKITLAHGALGIVLRLPDGERALYATPVWRERCCEALAPLRVLQVPLVLRRAVQWYCILRHMQQSVGINNGSTLLSIKIHPLSQSVKMLRILLFCDKNCAISAILALTFAKI